MRWGILVGMDNWAEGPISLSYGSMTYNIIWLCCPIVDSHFCGISISAKAILLSTFPDLFASKVDFMDSRSEVDTTREEGSHLLIIGRVSKIGKVWYILTNIAL